MSDEDLPEERPVRELQDLLDRFDEGAKKVQKLKQENRRLKEQLDDIRSEQENVSSTAEELRNERDALRDDLTVKKDRIQELKEKLADKDDRIQHLEQQLAAAQQGSTEDNEPPADTESTETDYDYTDHTDEAATTETRETPTPDTDEISHDYHFEPQESSIEFLKSAEPDELRQRVRELEHKNKQLHLSLQETEDLFSTLHDRMTELEDMVEGEE